MCDRTSLFKSQPRFSEFVTPRPHWCSNGVVTLPESPETIENTGFFAFSAYIAVAHKKYFNHTVSSTLPRYDLLGYDQMRHLLQLLQTSADSIATPVWNGLQADIQYHRVSPDGGYENRQIHIIRK